MNLATALSLIQIGIAGVKAGEANNPDAQQILGYIETAENAIAAALQAVQQAQTAVDPAALKHIDEVP